MDGGKTGLAGRLRPLRRLNDDDLAAAAAQGDARALGVVFERYHEPLYRYCAALLDDPELISTALQNTMGAAKRGLEEGERSIPLRPWLHRLADAECLALLEAGGWPMPEIAHSAVLLHEMNGLEYTEVADTLGITTNAARQAVREARATLGPAAGSPGQLGRELREVYALPPGVAAALLGAGEVSIGSDGDEERPRHRVLLSFLVLAVVIGSTVALAALGTFDSGGGGGGDHRAGGPGATPVQVTPGPGPAQPARKGGRKRKQHGAGSAAGAGGGAGGGTSSGSAAGAAVAGTAPSGLSSAAAAYTTPGERIESAVGIP